MTLVAESAGVAESGCAVTPVDAMEPLWTPAIASMMDITLSQAVRSAYPSGINVSTISMTVNYLAPSQGNALSHAQVIRAGHSIAYAEGDVKNEAGDIVCRVSGSYRIIRPK